MYLDPRLPPGKLAFTRGRDSSFLLILASWNPGVTLVKTWYSMELLLKTRGLPGFLSLSASEILSPTLIDLNSHRNDMFYPGIYQENPRFPHG